LFSQQIVNGLCIGATYALMAVGYNLVYGILNFTNFAHGAVVMLSAYGAYYVVILTKPNVIVAMLASMLCGALVSALYEVSVYRKMRHRKSKRLYLVIAGYGIATIIQNSIIASVGGRFKVYPSMFNLETTEIGRISFSALDMSILVIAAVALLILVVLLDKTKIGLAIRASSFKIETVSFMGVNADALVTIVFMIAGALAGLSGVLLGVKYTVNPQMGILANKAFISSVFGGLGSLQGAVLGALLLGIIETLVSGYISSSLRDVFSFGILLLVLIIRPAGLMGKTVTEKA